MRQKDFKTFWSKNNFYQTKLVFQCTEGGFHDKFSVILSQITFCFKVGQMLIVQFIISSQPSKSCSAQTQHNYVT